MGYMDEYQPATASQVSLVETMAVARWRQLRVWGAQKTAMDRDMALQDPNIGPAPVRVLSALRGSPDSSCPPEVLLRYEIAFDRQFSRALTRLLALQSRLAIQHAQPYHPASQSGQTWKEENISTANRTYQVHENKASENERMKMNVPEMPEPTGAPVSDTATKMPKTRGRNSVIASNHQRRAAHLRLTSPHPPASAKEVHLRYVTADGPGNSHRLRSQAAYSSSIRRTSAASFVSYSMPPSSAIPRTLSRWVPQTLSAPAEAGRK